MQATATKRVVVLCIVVLASLLAAGAAFAQEETPAPVPGCVADDVTSCVKIVFSPTALVGDLVTLDKSVDPAVEVPTTQVQQNTLWVTFTNPAPGMSADIVVKNIFDGTADNGPLYIYPDIAKTVTAPAAGSTTTTTLYPIKKYIRGKVTAKCSPNAVQEGEEVMCLLSVDGVLVETPLAAGQIMTLILDPGPHTLQFDLAGETANLWSPLSVTKKVTVYAGSYPQVATALFLKSAHVVASLSKAAEGWVGDFYLDGELVATQVGSIEAWAAANKSHKIEVRNIAPATSPLIHPYKDATATFYATTASNKTVTLTMTAHPSSAFVTPFDFCYGTPNTLTEDSLVVLQVSWLATAKEIAEYAADHIQVVLILDGVNLGDLSAYRKPVYGATLDELCDFEGFDVEVFIVDWFVPVGKLAPGTHTLHAQLIADSPVSDGFAEYPAGVLLEGEGTFDIFANVPATP